MPAIKPFQAIFYNKEKIENLSDVICPPYDVISKDIFQARPWKVIEVKQ